MSVEKARTEKGKVKLKSTEPKTVAKANTGRRALWLTNPSTVDAWIALGPSAAKEEGLYLRKEGGALVIPGEQAWEGYTGEVTAASTSGEPEITFVEV